MLGDEEVEEVGDVEYGLLLLVFPVEVREIAALLVEEVLRVKECR